MQMTSTRIDGGLRRSYLWAPLVLTLTVAVLGPFARGIRAQSASQGEWTTLPYGMPINPVHLALMNNGMVLVVSGSGNVAAETTYRVGVWDPVQGSITTQTLAWDMFCNGMVTLPDGRVFVDGGTLQYDPFHGQLRTAAFDPNLGLFSDLENMAHGRWYPTVTELGDGRIMAFSGLTETGATNTAVELYTPGTGWSPEYAAGWTPPLYPRMHLLPNGTIFYSGSTTGSRIFNPSTHTWSSTVATTNYSGTRTYGTSVLLPLSPSDGYRARVMIFGGGNPSTSTTELIEPLAATPAWSYGPPMSQPRIEMNATILPNGKILAVGGSLNDEDTTTASLNADLYDPGTNSFSSAGANVYPRLYHSGSLLLPDATVALLGGNPARGSYESHIEIYSPAYLFNADGTRAARPTISGVSTATVDLGSTFQVFTPDAASISSVVLVRPGAPTHAFDMDQRLIALNFSAGPTALDVTAPPNGNVAPPGYYMVFVLNQARVPSVASFIHLGPAPANQPPTAAITSPSTDVTIAAGQSVSFSGTGADSDGTISAYAWSFPGGTPSSSTQASPGSVTYSAPGTFVASLKVTDNGGLVSPAATRTVVVPDFAIAASPASRSVTAGSTTSYGTTITGGAGFNSVVALTITGLPAGTSASFTPSSVTGSGSSTVNVVTTAATPGGTYQLTIAGSSGGIVHQVNVALVVTGDFAVAATPSSATIARDGIATYTVTVTAGAGFSGTTTLTVSGVPRQATAKFTPASIVNSGTAKLTVDTKKQVARGSYTLTITGASGGLTHSITVTMVVQ